MYGYLLIGGVIAMFFLKLDEIARRTRVEDAVTYPAYGAWRDLKNRLKTLAVWIFMIRETQHAKTKLLWQRTFEMRAPHYVDGNSHAEAAANRTAAQHSINNWIDKHGYRTYNISMSSREDANALGTHHFIDGKDLAHPPRWDDLPRDSIIVGIDVDYYLDLPIWAHFMLPMIFYTFTPQALSFSNKEYAYSIDSSSAVEMIVSGGSKYTHRLWDYDHDVLAIQTSAYKFTIWNVDRKRPEDDAHHTIVALFPICAVPLFLSGLFECQWLQRKWFFLHRPGGDVIVNEFLGDHGRMLSLRRPCTDTCVTIERRVYELCATQCEQARDTKHGPTLTAATVERHIKQSSAHIPASEAGAAATLLTPIITAIGYIPIRDTAHATGILRAAGRKPGFKPPPRDPTRALHYHLPGNSYNQDFQLSGRQFAPPLVTCPAMFPYRCRNNDEATIRHRVAAVRNDKSPPTRYQGYAREFANFVVGDRRSKGIPIPADDLYDLQCRPTQRKRLDDAAAMRGDCLDVKVSAFQKREAYSEAKPPRNISTVPSEHTFKLSLFTYAFKKDCLVDKAWYAPCKTPIQIADRVVTLPRKRSIGRNRFL